MAREPKSDTLVTEMITILSLILGILGLGFLVFIHELGHYWVARWVGIRVEAFSIGFGKPILRWHRGSCEWRIGWLPFGGYVRMAGMEKKDGKQPYEIPGGFYHARPIDRIKVALAGPFINLFFAFLLLVGIWVTGGREQNFSNATTYVGWVDPHSALYAEGIRPGDRILSYDGHPVSSLKDHLYAPMLATQVRVEGERVEFERGQRAPFLIDVAAYPHPNGGEEGLMTIGMMSPAQYLIAAEEPKPLDSAPIWKAGLQEGDRLFWIDGELLFSHQQLAHLLEEGAALVTIERNGQKLLRRVPRMPIGTLDLPFSYREELSDWHYGADLEGRFSQSYFLPYEIDSRGIVLGPLPRLESGVQRSLPDGLNAPLEAGDRLLVLDGAAFDGPVDLMKRLQNHSFQIIVQSEPEGAWPVAPAAFVDAEFDHQVNWQQFDLLLSKIKRGEPDATPFSAAPGQLRSLAPIHPTSLRQWALERLPAQSLSLKEEQAFEEQLKEIGDRPVLGVVFRDRKVRVNPPPTTLFAEMVVETGRTFKALISGNFHPKFLSGPVGIVQGMQMGWSLGLGEGLYWLALISLNLGILNLLPIPVLDGGHICFALWEWISRRRLKAELMEKVMIPFVFLLIGFFVYVTYQDITRIIRNFF